MATRPVEESLDLLEQSRIDIRNKLENKIRTGGGFLQI